MPAVAAIHQCDCGLGSPGSRLIFNHRRGMGEYRVDHLPGRFDAGVLGKQRRIAADRIAEQALIGGLLAPRFVAGSQFHRFAFHVFAVLFDQRAGANHHFGT